MTSPDDLQPGDICAVTVTYGDRLATLMPLLAALAGLGLGRVVVVGNGISDAVAARLADWVPAAPTGAAPTLELVRLAQNGGSAPGFATGLEAAFAAPATQAAWLLDDDNLPDADCLARLCAALGPVARPVDPEGPGGLPGRESDRPPNRAPNAGGDGCVAVTALRRDRAYLADVARAGEASAMRLRRGQVFGHDLRVFPAKLWRKLAGRRPGASPAPRSGPDGAPDQTIAIPRAPYGGLLLPRAVWARIGGPRADFVLYADDLEFTERVAACGRAGAGLGSKTGSKMGPKMEAEIGSGLGLVPGAVLADAEASWNMDAGSTGAGNMDAGNMDVGDGARDSARDRVGTQKPQRRQRNTWRLARSAGDFRLFYAVRNAVYLDMRRDGFSLWLVINTAWFLSAVTVAALIAGRPRNAAVTARAVWRGVAGRLGPDPRFPLPQ